MTDDIIADATQDDGLIEELPSAFPDEVPADHATDPDWTPAAQFDEGLEVAP